MGEKWKSTCADGVEDTEPAKSMQRTTRMRHGEEGFNLEQETVSPLTPSSCSRPLAPTGGNDCVWTPPYLAKYIVEHFKPSGRILEPCRGIGSFTDQMPGCDWCEISEGRDFFAVEDHWDWIVTNPPWSKFRPFLRKAMQVSDNVVFLALLNAWFMKARVRDMREAGFGLVEALMIETPPKPWPQTGFQLAAVHAKRGYDGLMKFSCENDNSTEPAARNER